jgi:hypothetical protein
LGYVWGLWKQNVSINQIAKDNYILCWAAKWLGEEEVFQSSRSFATEKAMLKGIHKLLDEADAVIHFNGKSFDVPWLNGAFLINKIAPPSPFKEMERYNVIDVVIMEDTYNRLLPWIKGHASHSVLNETGERVCPRCGGTHHHKRGFTYTNASKFQRFQCRSCHGWFKDNVILNRKAYKTSEII